MAKQASEIRQVLDAQTDAWNEGDVERFLEGYWNSPELLFGSRGRFSKGWQPVLERYKEAYPVGEMGQLRFEDVKVFSINDRMAWVVGSWSLEQKDSSPRGVFTLIWEKKADGWRIIHDHSSGVPEDN